MGGSSSGAAGGSGVAVSGDAAVVGVAEMTGYATELSFAPPHDAHRLVSDQSAEVAGGTGRGPNPFSFLYAALASCTAMSVRGYAARKGIGLERVRVEVVPRREEGKSLESIGVRVVLEGDLSDDDRKRLMSAAAGCPVKKALVAGVAVEQTDG